MDLQLYTWNSLAINDSNPFIAVFPPGQKANLAANVVSVPRADDDPFLSDTQLVSSVLVINVYIAAGQNIDTSRETLKKYFNVRDKTRHNLIAKDHADSDKQYYLTGYPVGISALGNAERNAFTVRLAIEHNYWQLVTATTDAWAITSTADTQAITNAGNIKVPPLITLTPTTTKTAGLKYRRYVSIYNNLDKSFVEPLDITNGGIDTGAIVADTSVSNQINEGAGIDAVVTTWNIDVAVGGGLPTTGGTFYMGTEQCSYTTIAAGVISGVVRGINGTVAATHADNVVMYRSKIQADGDDLRVWLGSSFSDRWLNGMNGSTTKCWINFNLAFRKEGTLLTSVNNSVTTFVFTQTRDSTQFLQRLKMVSNLALRIESELVTFEIANIDLVNYQITGLVRGAKGSTAASHTAPQTVRHIEYDLWLMYGDSSLTAPDVDDDYKPVLNLASTNALWTWTNFFDDGSHRSAMWAGGVESSKTGLSYVYTDDENNFTDPSTELGLALINYADNRVQFEAGVVAWTFTHPAGMTNVDYDGEKYTTSDTSFPGVVGLQYLQPNTAWFTAQNEALPASTYTWESLTQSVDLGGTRDAIRFAIDGALNMITSEMAMAQFDNVEVTLDSANLPTISVGAEQAINFFDFKITNNTTGEFILVKSPCPINTTLTIDTENKEAYLADGTRVGVTLSTDRTDWLDLAVGSNTLQFDDVGTVAITGAVTHRDRVL